MNNISFYLDKRRKKDDGVYPIRIYLCHRKAIFVSTGLSAHEDEWEGKYISAKARNARARNSMLRNILDRVETLVISLSKDKKLPFMSDKELAAVHKGRNIRRTCQKRNDSWTSSGGMR
mgnify:CR=1 FL=1